MPSKPLRPCNKAGCNVLTSSGYCDKHMPIHTDNCRLTAYERGYNKSWTKLRIEYLASNPYCYLCNKQGKRTIATLVHHIKRIVDGGAVLDRHNLMSLCDECHRDIHKHDIFVKRWKNVHLED